MLLELVGRPRCLGCGGAVGPLCARCFEGMPPASVGVSATSATRVLAGCAYQGPARSLVLGLKLRSIRSYAVPLGELCVRQIHLSGVRANVVTWVPGRRAETNRRGFDHAAEIARIVAALTGLPAMALLSRRAETTDQTRLSRVDRFKNLEGAFAARPHPGRVLVVDDLITTGATIKACATALEEAGVDSVEAIAACRA